jgi:glutaredoxin
MTSKVKYEKVEEYIPELRNTEYTIVIIGYKTCPYSKKALRAVETVPEWSENYKFIGYDFGETGPLKEDLGYEGTFPMCFVRDETGKVHHIGGGTELERLAGEFNDLK